MKFRSTVVVLGLAVILGGYVYFHEVKGGKNAAARRAQAEKLLGIDPAQVAAIRIRHSGTQFDLEKRDGIWYLLHPLPAPCDPRVIGAYLDTLAMARREDEVGRGDLVRYGLDAPAAQVEIDVGGKTRKLALGRINPLQTLVYALVDDSKEVVLTTSSLLTASLNNALGWRDKRMIHVEPDQVQRISFRTIANGDMTIRHDARFGWRVEGPVAWRVDPVVAQSLVQSLSQLEGVGVAAENKADLDKFGLGNQRVSAKLEAADGRVIGDLVAGFGDNKGAYFGMVPDKPEIFRVDAKTVDRWVELVREPRDHKALPPFLPEQVKRIEVRTSDDHFTLRRRSSTDWKVVASQRADSTLAIATGAVDAMLTDLATLQVAEFPAEQPRAALYDPAEIEVLLFGDGGQISGIQIGHKDPHGINLLARAPGEPAVYLISPSALLNVPFDLERLKADEAPAPETGDHG